MASQTKSTEQPDLRCTFADAERNHLFDGMRMTTREKIEAFEEMLDFAWRSGALKPRQPEKEFVVRK